MNLFEIICNFAMECTEHLFGPNHVLFIHIYKMDHQQWKFCMWSKGAINLMLKPNRTHSGIRIANNTFVSRIHIHWILPLIFFISVHDFEIFPPKFWTNRIVFIARTFKASNVCCSPYAIRNRKSIFQPNRWTNNGIEPFCNKIEFYFILFYYFIRSKHISRILKIDIIELNWVEFVHWTLRRHRNWNIKFV